MPRTLPFCLIDAFAETPCEGNAAGVLLDADDLTDAQMQLIAREVNASETAFVTGLSDADRPLRIRWFTPACEVDFCGHATLAAAHAVAQRQSLAALLDRPDAAIEFHGRPGLLPLRPERLPDAGPGRPAGAGGAAAGGAADSDAADSGAAADDAGRAQPAEPAAPERVVWWLGMPPPTWQRATVNPDKLLAALGLTRDQLDPRVPILFTRDADLVLFVRAWPSLQALRPDLDALDALCRRSGVRGVLVSTVGGVAGAVHVTSRFFAPAAGVAEDPVTGSAHGPLAAILVEHGLTPRDGDVAALHCVQGIPGGRTGVVRALVQGTRETGWQVLIGGRCHTTIAGEIVIPMPPR